MKRRKEDELNQSGDNPEQRFGDLRTEIRLAQLETHVDYFATKEEIQKLKNQIFVGAIGILVSVVVGILSIARILFEKLFVLLDK